MCVCVCVCVCVCSVMSDSSWPMDCSPPGSSVHEIFQVRILEWVAISYSRGSSQPGDRTCVSCISCIGRQILYHCATWEALKILKQTNKQTNKKNLYSTQLECTNYKEMILPFLGHCILLEMYPWKLVTLSSKTGVPAVLWPHVELHLWV